jgi:tetratricopeptide (TPR) repeat protein
MIYKYAKQLFLFEKRAIQKSEKLALKAGELDSENPKILRLLADICIRQNNHLDAIKHLEYAARLQFYDDECTGKTRAKPFFMIGKCYEHLAHKNFYSIQAYKKCLELDQSHHQASFRLAHILNEVDEGLHAIKYFDNALKVMPDYTEAHFGLMEANVDHVSEKGEAAMKHYQDKYVHE